jgi:hypothetical protein
LRRALFPVAAALLLSACPAAHDDYPTTACKLDSDCYVGESCDTKAGLCIAGALDMALDFSVEDGPITDDGGTP